MNDLPTVSSDPAIQAKYVKLRANGESHSMAEMLVHRSPPGHGMTDSAFMAGRWGGRDLGDSEAAGVMRGMASSAGVLTDGKVYSSQLAAFPGDPRAWVDSVAEVKAGAERRGLKLEGGINHTPDGFDDGPIDDGTGKYEVCDEIVNEHIMSEAIDCPELAAEYNAKPEKVHERHAELKKKFSGDE